jgi:uncharacterized protein (DUF302 family)
MRLRNSREAHAPPEQNGERRLCLDCGAMDAYERIAVPAPPADVVAALREALRERGITEYAVVDHGHDMAVAGAGKFVAWTLVFGNPTVGARVLEHDLAAAVDIPLRLAVIAGPEQGATIVLRDMRSLLGGELEALAEELTGVLRALAARAAELAAP